MKNLLKSWWAFMLITMLIFLAAVTFFEYTQGIDPTNFRILTIIMLYIAIMKK
jgi:hypothetical protein